MIGTLFNDPNVDVNGPTFTVFPVSLITKTFDPTTIDAACESSSVRVILAVAVVDPCCNATALILCSHSSLSSSDFLLDSLLAIAFKVVDLVGFGLLSLSLIPLTTETIYS